VYTKEFERNFGLKGREEDLWLVSGRWDSALEKGSTTTWEGAEKTSTIHTVEAGDANGHLLFLSPNIHPPFFCSFGGTELPTPQLFTQFIIFFCDLQPEGS
jgi:hypothetical protein